MPRPSRVTGIPSLQPHPFTVSLGVFEGPLDLLLHLVQAQKLAITTVSLVQVTGQYLRFMRAGAGIDHRALADFVAIGARLIELKSRALLPRPPAPPEAEDEADADDLVALLRRYQQFKDAAAALREREEGGLRAFPRLAPPPDVPALPGLSHVTLDGLAAIMQRALARTQPAPEPEPLRRPAVTVLQKMDEIVLLLRLAGRLNFARVIDCCRTRDETIAAFFAVLELMKAGRLVAAQTAAFGEITLLPALAVLNDAAAPAEAGSEAEFAWIEQAAGVERDLNVAQEVHA